MTALRVRFDDGETGEIPREWIRTHLRGGFQLTRTRKEIEAYRREDAGT